MMPIRRIRQKALCLLMCLCLLITCMGTTLPAFAEVTANKTIIYHNDFETKTTVWASVGTVRTFVTGDGMDPDAEIAASAPGALPGNKVLKITKNPTPGNNQNKLMAALAPIDLISYRAAGADESKQLVWKTDFYLPDSAVSFLTQRSTSANTPPDTRLHFSPQLVNSSGIWNTADLLNINRLGFFKGPGGELLYGDTWRDGICIPVTTNQWHRYTAVFDVAEWKFSIYIDGIPVMTAVGARTGGWDIENRNFNVMQMQGIMIAYAGKTETNSSTNNAKPVGDENPAIYIDNVEYYQVDTAPGATVTFDQDTKMGTIIFNTPVPESQQALISVRNADNSELNLTSPLMFAPDGLSATFGAENMALGARGKVVIAAGMYDAFYQQFSWSGALELPFTNGTPPENFTVTTISGILEVHLSWTASTAFEKYRIYRDGVIIAELDSNITEYIDTDVEGETRYKYYMVGVTASGSLSLPTEEIEIAVSSIATPENFAVNKTGDHEVTLSWTAVDDAVKYIINCNGEKIGETDEVTYIHSDIEWGSILEYTVQAVGISGNASLPSNAVRLIIENPDYTTFAEITDPLSRDETFYPHIVGDQKSVITKNLNLSQLYNKNSGSLVFLASAPEGTDLTDIYVGFSYQYTYQNVAYSLLNIVPLADYMTADGKLQYVDIPLRDFAKKGEFQFKNMPMWVDFNFAGITSIVFVGRTYNSFTEKTVHWENMKIVSYPAPAEPTPTPIPTPTPTPSAPKDSGGKNLSGSGNSNKNSAVNRPTVSVTIPEQSGNNSNISNTQGEESIELTDIAEVPWAEEAIRALVKEGSISGYPDNTFKPNQLITREEFISILIKAFALYNQAKTTTFTDADENAWYYKELAMAQEAGIVNGLENGEFGVGQYITREDACVLIHRSVQGRYPLLSKFDTMQYSDQNDIAEYALESITILQRAGVVNGVGSGAFDPKGFLTRAMAAKIIYEVKNTGR